MSSPLDAVSWPVRTERLAIRRATADDAAATWPYRSDPKAAEWVRLLPTDRAAYDEWYADPELLETRLVVEHEGELVGELHLMLQTPWSQYEVEEAAENTQADIGWVIAPAHQGQGFGTEVVRALLWICFEPLGLRRVTASCFADNEPSWRLMERLGMRREAHTVRDSLHRDRGWLDGYDYALLAEEWAAGPR